MVVARISVMRNCLLLAFLFLIVPVVLGADIFDIFKSRKQTSGSDLAGLTEEQLTRGLKEALATGIEYSVTNLAKPGGFLSNVMVRIEMPSSLKSLEKAARTLKQDYLVDQFVATMNQAAELAVPETGAILADAVRALTVEDARKLINGPDDAATQFFRKTSGAKLQERMLPIVKAATAKVEVTSSYQKLIAQAAPATRLFGKKPSDLDVDLYVTEKATDGLFKMIAEQEKSIRQNPAARTTELLQKIFSKTIPRS
jgi:hypothetical protein